MVNKNLKIEISYKIVIFAFVLFVMFFYRSDILPVVISVFFAFIIASGVLPIVNRLVHKGVRKMLAVLIVYLGLLLILGLIVLVVLIPFIQGLQQLANHLPSYIEELKQNLRSTDNIQILFWNLDKVAILNLEAQLTGYVGDITKNLQLLTQSLSGVLSTFKSFFSGLFSILTTIILSVYIVLDHDLLIENFIKRKIGPTHMSSVLKLVTNLETKLGNWVVGQFLLCIIIGLLNFVMLIAFDIPYAVPLAILAGVFEAVPNIGPIISTLPITLFAFVSGGPVIGLAVFICCILIQQLENNLIVPKIMGNAVGVRPVFVMVGILLGFSLGGVIGALLTLPILTVFIVLYEFYIDLQKLKAKGIF